MKTLSQATGDNEAVYAYGFTDFAEANDAMQSAISEAIMSEYDGRVGSYWTYEPKEPTVTAKRYAIFETIC